jgi:hypothetical protein
MFARSTKTRDTGIQMYQRLLLVCAVGVGCSSSDRRAPAVAPLVPTTPAKTEATKNCADTVPLFEDGKANGELNAVIPTTVMVSVFFGLMEIYSDEQSELHQTPPEDLSGSVSQLLLHGLLAKP